MEARNDYKENYTDWETVKGIASRILDGDIDAYADAIRQTEIFNEITHLGSSIEFSVENANLIKTTLHVNSEDVIPNEVKALLKSGKLSTKKMSKTRFYELYQDYVCSAILRVAREIFALLPIDMAIVTAVGELLNIKTGHLEEQSILSVAIPRAPLDRLIFEMLDPSDSMENFLHTMKFQKTKGFQAVEKIQPSEIDSSRAV